MAFRATRVLTRHARQRSSSVIAQLPRVTRSATSTTGDITQRFCTPTRRAFGAGGISGSGPPGAHTDASASRRSFGAGSIGEPSPPRCPRRREINETAEVLPSSSAARSGSAQRIERFERLNEKRKVHAAYAARPVGSELSMSERMLAGVGLRAFALGFHVTTEVVAGLAGEPSPAWTYAAPAGG